MLVSRSWLILTFTFLCFSARAQDYAPADQYLIDSLDLSTLSTKDIQLIDSALALYDRCNSPVCQIGAVSIIVQESWDINVWPRYNRWIHDFAAFQLGNTALDSAADQSVKISYAGALSNIGYLFNATGVTDSALYYYEQCLEIQQQIGDKAGQSATAINTGYIFLNQGMIEKALEYYYRSLRLEEELGNQTGIATALNGIGFIQYRQGDSESALENYAKSLSIREGLNDEYGMATCLNNIGLVYKDQGNWERALDYFGRCLNLQEKIEDKAGIVISLVNLGYVYKSLGQLTLAEMNYGKSLELSKELQDKQGMANSLNNLAQVALERGNLAKARRNAEESLRIANELNYPQFIRDASESLTEIAKRQGRWQEALGHHERYMVMRDSVFNEETVTASIHEQYRYRYQQEAMADSIRNANAQMIQEVENARLQAIATKSRQQVYFLITGILLALGFVWLLFNRMKTIRKQKLTIEAQNEELEVQKENLSQFAHTVSHDLKTPINGIIGLMHLIEFEHTELDEELRSKLDLMKKSAVQSNDLITGILAYSEADQKEIDVQQVDVGQLLRTILEELPNEKQVKIDLASDFSTIHCNELQLKQVFTNLINNAIKYNDKPKGEGVVTVKSGTRNGKNEFSVADNGPGIPLELHKTAFELFGKTHGGQYAFSSGVGLAIVKKLIEQNGGTISLDSDKGKGAQFTFTWP